MPGPLLAVVGFAAWTILLVLGIGSVRSFQVLTGEKKPNEFPSGQQHGGDAYWRLNRAHLNATENLPIFASIVIAGTLLGVESPLFQQLPWVVLAGRVCQSLVHISSGTSKVVMVRFSCYLVQVASMILLVIEIVRHAP